MNNKLIKEINHTHTNKFKYFNSFINHIDNYKNIKYDNKFIQKIENMDESPIRDNLDEIVYKNYTYPNINKSKDLDDIINKISNLCSYRYIMNTCFNEIDIIKSNHIEKIYKKINGLKEMYETFPFITEIFIKYTFKRYISENKNIEIIDKKFENSVNFEINSCGDHLNKCIIKINNNYHILTLSSCLIASYLRIQNLDLWTCSVIEDLFNLAIYHCNRLCPDSIKYLNNNTYVKLLKLIKKIDLLSFMFIVNNSIIECNESIVMCSLLGYINNDIPIMLDLLLDNEIMFISFNNNNNKEYIMKLLLINILYLKKYNKKIKYISILNIYDAKYLKYNISMFKEENFIIFENILPKLSIELKK